MEEVKRSKGHPRSFASDEELEQCFIDYIKDTKEKEELPNIAGFCVFANISRETFYEQETYYSYTFKRIQAILENAAINAKINDTFKIFYMKNKFNYKDKSEIDNNVNGKIEMSDEDKALLNNLYERLK